MSKEKDPWVHLGTDEQGPNTTRWYFNAETDMIREEVHSDVDGSNSAREYPNDGENTLPNNIQAELDEQMGDYRTLCPSCGGPINLVQFTGFTSIPVEHDGWSYGEEGIDSEGEIFKCTGDCGKYVPSAYVINNGMSKEEAAKKMNKPEINKTSKKGAKKLIDDVFGTPDQD